jgi:mono/diheme cytochrome c family protein/plastocyanin
VTDTPEQRLPAPRPDAQPAPAPRFSAPPSAHAFELTPERAAGIVRQSASARWWGFLAVLVIVLFVIVYYFYELGVPGVANTSRLGHEIDAQEVTSVERGYNIYEANCARCHGVNGQGFANEAGAPPLNEQDKLFAHLNKTYLASVLREGGRFVCGNAKSLMPVWSNDNGGPLNYQQIDDLITFLRATNDHTYIVRDPATGEPIKDDTGKTQTFTGWVDPTYKPAAGATPFPDCWTSAFTGGGGTTASASPGASAGASVGASGAPSGTTLNVTAVNTQFNERELTAPAGQPFAIKFDNQDAGMPHNIEIKDGTGATVFKGDIITGVTSTTYSVPALPAGIYPFNCTVHPTMTGTLTVK